MKNSVKRIISLLLVFILTLALGIPAFADNNINGSNWMSTIPDDKKLTEITIPGTHDSGTSNVLFSTFARTQTLSIEQQLNAGVRFFDFRCNYDGGKFKITHSIIDAKSDYGLFAKELTATSIIASMKSFLKANPGETILFFLREQMSKEGKNFYTLFYNRYIRGDENLWYTANNIPYLADTRGKIVLLNLKGIDETKFDDSNSGLNFTNYDFFGDTDSVNVYSSHPIVSYDTGEEIAKLCVQDSYMLSVSNKWKTIKYFWDSGLSSDDFNINCTSSSSGYYPEKNAKQINKKLLSYEFTDGKVYGIVDVDFVTEELARKIYSANKSIMVNEPTESSFLQYKLSYSFLGRIMQFFRDLFSKML